jgi:coatomer subunit beta'
VTISCEDAYYVLRFSRAAYTKFIERGGEIGEEGVEEAFGFVAEVAERYINGVYYYVARAFVQLEC